MGMSSKGYESDNYKLREIVGDDLGKIFIYDRVEDNIERISQSNETPICPNNANVLLHTKVLIRIILSILILVAALISVFRSADVRKYQSSPNFTVDEPTISPVDSVDPPLELTHDRVNVGSLQERKTFSDTLVLNRKNRIKYYLFSLKTASNVNIFLNQGVTNEVGMWLCTDTNGNGVIDSGERIDMDSASYDRSSTGTIKKSLGAGNYILVVAKIGSNTKYAEIVGNTSYIVTITSQ